MTSPAIVDSKAGTIAVQFAVSGDELPAKKDFICWASAVLDSGAKSGALCIRIVDEYEGRDLNKRYRRKDYATNVLGFSADPPLLGDVVLCAPVVAREAMAQRKSQNAHYAHLTVHGVLHLLGYDHQLDAEARQMEAEERLVLAKLGFSDPYASDRLDAGHTFKETH